MKTLLALLFAVMLSGCVSVPTTPKVPPRMAIFNDGQVVVGIVDQPCTSEGVKAMIREDLFNRFKAGRVVIKGMGAFDLCWAPGEAFADVEALPEGSIFIADELGNFGPVPGNMFFETKENPLDDQKLRAPSSI